MCNDGSLNVMVFVNKQHPKYQGNTKKGIVKRLDAMKTIFGASKKMVAHICRMVPTNPGDIGSIFMFL